ncbi:MAG: flagellar basal body-associated FliL family protein [Deltaproteobacteria bacterium]|nr:flagellar basal body-associated FliL family protein [Deltaproteobacteria bacterium]
MARDIENEEDEKEAPVERKWSTGRIIGIVAGANVIVIAIAIVALRLIMAPPGPKTEEPRVEGKEHGKVAERRGIGPLVNLDGFIVNIPGEDGNHYLKASMSVEATGEEGKALLEEKMQIVRNEVLMYLSGLNVGSTRSVKQKRDMEARLRTLLNRRLGNDVVAGAFFTEFVTQ